MRFVNSKNIQRGAAIAGLVVLAAQGCSDSSGGSAQKSFQAGGAVQVTTTGTPSFGHVYNATGAKKACRWSVYTINKKTGNKVIIDQGGFGDAKLSFPSEPSTVKVYIKSNTACNKWTEIK